MGKMELPAAARGAVRPDFVPKQAYISRDYVELEKKRLWSRVWQVACREEEIPRPGDYLTYDIADESVIVTRDEQGAIRAYHNVCMHRGRRLTEATGHARTFVCRYHGWRWNLQGQNTRVVDRDDWGDMLKDDEIRLKEVRVGTWAGFVFINMDPHAEPLEQFLDPLPGIFRNFQFEKLRFRWYKTIVQPCNWKVVLEAFDEAYHVQQTHPQFLEYLSDYSQSAAYGKHGSFSYPALASGQSRFTPSPRLNKPATKDFREYVLAYFEEMHTQLQAMVTPRSHAAAQRLRTEVPQGATQQEVLMKLRQFQQEAAEADGSGWPHVTPQDMQRAGADWHVFPNLVFLPSNIDGIIAYRGRPNGDDPDSCVFDVWSLVRYAPGQEPPLERENYTEWKDTELGRILKQDFQNLGQVQKGMKSSAFPGSRTNPQQERAISNFHAVLHDYLAQP
jgi:phenylpropionate dioxygenase-like ring-hydroxylating dioxygenase large terminal subunit